MLPDVIPTCGETILVMDSRGVPAVVRGPSICESWNRLYKMEHHYLDLSLEVDDPGLFLTGKLPTPGPVAGRARLAAEDQELLREAELGALRMFRFQVTAGKVYQLELSLDGHLYVVHGICALMTST